MLDPDHPELVQIPEAAYHADPVPGGSMSSTAARRILRSPAHLHHDLTHPVHKDVYDLGSAVHALVLGVGTQIVEVPTDSWRTAAARQARSEARAAGHVALLTEDLQRARAIAAAVHAHPLASALLAPGTYMAEHSIAWRDPETSIACRAMIDALGTQGERPMVLDLKTTISADPRSLGRTVAEYGYHQQASWYLDAVEAVGIHDAVFVLIFVEKTPPYGVGVTVLDDDALTTGALKNSQARRLWAECHAADSWPGYPPVLHTTSLPAWA